MLDLTTRSFSTTRWSDSERSNWKIILVYLLSTQLAITTTSPDQFRYQHQSMHQPRNLGTTIGGGPSSPSSARTAASEIATTKTRSLRQVPPQRKVMTPIVRRVHLSSIATRTMPPSFYAKAQELHVREKPVMLPACAMLRSADFSHRRMPILSSHLESMAKPLNTRDSQAALATLEALWPAADVARLACANQSATRDKSAFSMFARDPLAILQERETLFVSFPPTPNHPKATFRGKGFRRARAPQAFPRLHAFIGRGSQLLTWI